MNDTHHKTMLLAVAAAMFFIAGYGCGSFVGERDGREAVKKTAVKLGLAYWDADPQTGGPAFHWKKD